MLLEKIVAKYEIKKKVLINTIKNNLNTQQDEVVAP